jgi:Pup amidohydrolase
MPNPPRPHPSGPGRAPAVQTGPSNRNRVTRVRLPKLCGADVELGNFFSGMAEDQGTGYEASRLLLREIDGLVGQAADTAPAGSGAVPSASKPSEGTGAAREATGYYSQDWGRKFLFNGGCAYVDLNHLEVCIPEVLSAFDHVACSAAMLRVACRAARSINARLREKGLDRHRLVVLANNSDGMGNSYGSHLNFLISREAWEDLFHRRVQFQLFLAAYQASSIVFTGQGKAGSENRREPVPYQISQRADFFEIVAGPQTTSNRPLVNSRDESLCAGWPSMVSGDDPASRMARLHVIFYDTNLCQVSAFLKVGVLQIILSMIEASWMNNALILDDPVEAVLRWSHDPDLRARAGLVGGSGCTAVELQLRFWEEARRFVEAGGCEEIVPDAQEIIRLWGDTLAKLEARDFAGLAPRLDWVLKRTILEQAVRQRPGLDWTSPEIKYLDHLYSNLDPEEGLYWAYERNGFVQRLVTEARVDHFEVAPPAETRAWTRSLLLQLARPEDVDSVDWDSLRFKIPSGPGSWPEYQYRRVSLANPLAHTKAETEALLPEAATFLEVLDRLEGLRANGPDPSSSPKSPSVLALPPNQDLAWPSSPALPFSSEPDHPQP